MIGDLGSSRGGRRGGPLGRDHGISRATAYHYVAEAVDVLSGQAPSLPDALERAAADGAPYVILDGKVFAADRCSAPVTSVKGQVIDAWYSGKAHCHGGSVQAVTRPGGLPVWTSPAEPGSVHDLTAARLHALPRDLRCRGERGFALLTQRWAALQHITADPARITDLYLQVRALTRTLVGQSRERNQLTAKKSQAG